MNVKLISE